MDGDLDVVGHYGACTNCAILGSITVLFFITTTVLLSDAFMRHFCG